MQKILLGIIVLCLLVSGSRAQQNPVQARDNENHDDKVQRIFPPIQKLVKMYAPKVYLHSKEKYKMSSVEWYLRRVRQEQRITDPSSLTGDEILSYANGDTFKLLSENVTDETITNNNLHSPNNELIVLSHKTGRVGYGRQFWAKCYVHVKPSYYQDIPPFFEHEIDIQYYFFYPFNGTALHHEGDWETFIVKVSPDGTIRKIGMSSHGDVKWYNADQLSYQKTHPIVYAANKSHAFYEDKGHYVPAVFTSPDVTNRGRSFKSWNNIEIVAIDDSILNPKDSQPIQNNGIDMVNNNWLNYTGKWGKKGANIDIGIFGFHEDSKGPVGPKTYADYWNGKVTNQDQGYITPHLFGQYPDSLIVGPASISSKQFSSYSINNLPSNTEIISWDVQPIDSTKSVVDLVLERTAQDNSNISLKAKQSLNEEYLDITAIVHSDYGSYKIVDQVKKRVRVMKVTKE